LQYIKNHDFIEDMDIHNYKRQYERQIEIIKEATDISQENKEWILKFKDYAECLNPSKEQGVKGIVYRLSSSGKTIKKKL